MGHLAARGSASRYMAHRSFTGRSANCVISHFFKSAIDCFNDSNSVLVQFTLPAVDSLIRSGWTFTDQKLTWLFFLQNVSHRLSRRLNNATRQCPVVCPSHVDNDRTVARGISTSRCPVVCPVVLSVFRATVVYTCWTDCPNGVSPKVPNVQVMLPKSPTHVTKTFCSNSLSPKYLMIIRSA